MGDLRLLGPISSYRTAGLIDPAARVEDSRAADPFAQRAAEIEGVIVEISPAGRAYARLQGRKNDKDQAGVSSLSAEEEELVRQLSEQDRQVRTHEMAHYAAGGGLVRGGPNYSFRTGPDGKRYAVSGEVSIDVSPVRNDPKATLQKATRVRAAALAPADPSPQDRQVAAQADRMAQQARADELAAA
jgi:hypothetical protein